MTTDTRLLRLIAAVREWKWQCHPSVNTECAAPKFYILDARSVVGNCDLFWGPDGRGYVCDLDRAGLYLESPTSRETDVPVDHHLAQRLSERHVDLSRLRQHMEIPRG